MEGRSAEGKLNKGREKVEREKEGRGGRGGKKEGRERKDECVWF